MSDTKYPLIGLPRTKLLFDLVLRGEPVAINLEGGTLEVLVRRIERVPNFGHIAQLFLFGCTEHASPRAEFHVSAYLDEDGRLDQGDFWLVGHRIQSLKGEFALLEKA